MTAAPEVPRQAMVLAAGFGERLRPLTEGRAKPALPLMNRPLVLHVLDALERAGVERVVVNLHHAPASLREAVDGGAPPTLSVSFSPEESILGTGGGVQAGLSCLDPGRPLLIMNGDSLIDLDLAFLARRHRDSVSGFDAAATLALRAMRPGDPFTPVHVDEEGAICGIGRTGKEGAPHVFMGIHILQPETMAGRPAGEPWDLVRDLYMPLLREGRRLGAALHDGWWIEIGTPRLYLAAHMQMLEERSFISALPAASGCFVRGEDAVFAAPGGSGLSGASVRRSVLGPDCLLDGECGVSGSLLGRGVRVGARARVKDCILWDGCEVEPGRELSGSLAYQKSGTIVVEPLR